MIGRYLDFGMLDREGPEMTGEDFTALMQTVGCNLFHPQGDLDQLFGLCYISH